MNSDTCVVCGAYVPEGRQVCRKCENSACPHVWLYDGMIEGETGRYIDYKCRLCGEHRVGVMVKRKEKRRNRHV